MAMKSDSINPDDVSSMFRPGEAGMELEAREYLKELRADEDAARRDGADDGECVDRETGIEPDEDLPEMEIIMNNIYVM